MAGVSFHNQHRITGIAPEFLRRFCPFPGAALPVNKLRVPRNIYCDLGNMMLVPRYKGITFLEYSTSKVVLLYLPSLIAKSYNPAAL